MVSEPQPNERYVMSVTKVFGIFAAVFAVVYTIAFEWHWELFSYHPRLGVFGWGQQASREGPVMHWYGCLATAFLVAAAISLAALPFLRKRSVPLWIGWAVPLLCLAVWLWFLRAFFLR
jgi:hypothetical protein